MEEIDLLDKKSQRKLRIELAQKKTDILFLNFISKKENFSAIKSFIEECGESGRKDEQLVRGSALEKLQAIEKDELKAATSDLRTLPPRKGTNLDVTLNSSKLFLTNRSVVASPFDKSYTLREQKIEPLSLGKLFLELRVSIHFPKIEESLTSLLARASSFDQDFFDSFTTQILDLPRVFAIYVEPILSKLSRAEVVELVKREFSVECRSQKAFGLMRQFSPRHFLTREDFRPLLHAIISSHDDYAMLREEGAKAFCERFVATCLETIFFVFDVDDDGRLLLHDFHRLEFLEHVDALGAKLTRFNCFNYDNFYVACRSFDQLTAGSEQHLSRAELDSFHNHALSGPVLDRIFAGAPRGLVAAHRMGYEDFVWFLLAAAEKAAPSALRYWFRALNEAESGVLGPAECERFFELARGRLELIEDDSISFENWSQLLLDIFGKRALAFTLREWEANPRAAACLVECLTSVEGLREFLGRDPYLPPPRPPFAAAHRFFAEGYAAMADEADEEPDASLPEE